MGYCSGVVTKSGIFVRAVNAQDETNWKHLYRQYRGFYELLPDDEVVDRTWGWVRGHEHGISGLVAVRDDKLVGLANLRRFARPSSATRGLYLDDLFTSPEHRRAGVGSALLSEAKRIGADEGANVVRWVTAETNSTARSLYNSVATATHWVTYDMSI